MCDVYEEYKDIDEMENLKQDAKRQKMSKQEGAKALPIAT